MKKKTKSLKEIFNMFPTTVRLYDGSKPMYKGAEKPKRSFYFGCDCLDRPCINIQWSEKGRGFGEYVFYMKNGKLYCNNECDDKATVKRILCTLVDQAIFTEPKETKCSSKVKSSTKPKLPTKTLPKSHKDS